ncbi:MAG: hypothetical protein ACOX8B_05890 [Lachnospiraceae bacterium]
MTKTSKMKPVVFCVIAAAALIVGAAAGKTTVRSNTAEFFSQVSSRLNENSGSSDSRTALDSPANFTVDNDGNYSFDTVDNADYYVVYVYNEGESIYGWSTGSLTGEGTITGSIADLGYPFGTYDVAVVAYPSYEEENLKQSSADNKVQIVKSGEVVEPEFSWYWDCFSQTLSVVWNNSSDYASTSYPLTMDITAGDLSSTVEMDSGTSMYAVEGAEGDQTYDLSLTVNFDSGHVTNSTFDVDLGSAECDADMNTASEDYEYSHVYSYADYPYAAYGFDPEEGGSIGEWRYTEKNNGMFGFPGAQQQTEDTGPVTKYLQYTAEPTDTEEGDLYTFTYTAAFDDGSAITTTRDNEEITEFTGTVHFCEDGTFKVETPEINLGIDPMNKQYSYMNASSIEGAWHENDDGTIDMSYDLSTEMDLGHSSNG